MNSVKYANLPYIDSAPDVYETEDVLHQPGASKGDLSDDDAPQQTRSSRIRNGDTTVTDGLDSSHLISSEQATKVFRKAERKRDRLRTHYAYPSSPTSSVSSMDIPSSARPVSLAQRLKNLQAELAALETEVSDPSNPQLHKEQEEDKVDPGELIRGLVDVRARLDKIRKEKEGRGKLVGVILGTSPQVPEIEVLSKPDPVPKSRARPEHHNTSVSEMDKRVAQLEKLVGSSTVSVDELSPLPSPLLPLLARLNSQLTILTQPRHIDSISRRLKLLLSDLDRTTASQLGHRRQGSQPSPLQDQLIPVISRLGPALPQIPHLLSRLRTLSSLHASASEFQSSLTSLEEEQKRIREALGQLEAALETVEKSLDANKGVIQGNVEGLEGRVDALFRKLEDISRAG